MTPEQAIDIRVRLESAIRALRAAQGMIPRGEGLGYQIFRAIDGHIDEALDEATAARTLCVQAVSA